jgi:hypothetical protein
VGYSGREELRSNESDGLTDGRESMMMRAIHPRIGTKKSSCHQPDRPISWSLRVAIASAGTRVAKMKMMTPTKGMIVATRPVISRAR